MAHRFLLVLLTLLALALVACKGATNGKVPVDHPMYEHLPPPEVADAEDEDDEGDDDDEEDDEEPADAGGTGGGGEGAQ